MNFTTFNKFFVTGLLIAVSLFVLGCSDADTSSDEALTEDCKQLLNEEKFDEAIDTCGSIDTDEGKSLTADAYMGRAGLSIVTLFSSLDGDGSTVSLLSDYLPDTASRVSDYEAAIELIESISSPDSNDSMKMLIASTLLVYQVLITVFDYNISDGTSCYDDASCNASVYNDFFVATCNLSYGGTNPCTVQTGSYLYYNEIAGDALSDLGDFSTFNIKDQIDSNASTSNANDDELVDGDLDNYVQNGSF